MTDPTTTTHASGPRAGQPVTPVPDDAARRREWVAAYRDAANHLADHPLANDWARSLAGLLLERADEIESGQLTPWADQPEPDGLCPKCGRKRSCPVHDIGRITPSGAAPAAAGSHPPPDDQLCADPGCGCCYPGGLEEAQPTGDEVIRYAVSVAGIIPAAHRAVTQAVIHGILQDGWRRPAAGPHPDTPDVQRLRDELDDLRELSTRLAATVEFVAGLDRPLTAGGGTNERAALATLAADAHRAGLLPATGDCDCDSYEPCYGACCGPGQCSCSLPRDPATPLAQPARERPADADAHLGTSGGSGAVPGRALLTAGGHLWGGGAGDPPDEWHNAGWGELTRAEVERACGEVREVLLVSPAAGRVLDALLAWRRVDGPLALADETAAAVAELRAAVDALDGDQLAEPGTIGQRPAAAEADFGETLPDQQPAEPAPALRCWLAAIENALRNGSYMTNANLAFELLCDWLRVDRRVLTFDPMWSQRHQPAPRPAPEPDSGPGPNPGSPLVGALAMADAVAAKLGEEDADAVRRAIRHARSLARRCAIRFEETSAARAELAEVTADRDRLADEATTWKTRLVNETADLRAQLDAARTETAGVRDELTRVAGDLQDRDATLALRTEQLRGAHAEAGRLGHEVDRLRAELADGGNDLLAIRGILSPNGQPRRVPDHVPMVPFAAPAVAWLADEVDRLGDRLTQVAAEYEVELATARRDAAADTLEMAGAKLAMQHHHTCADVVRALAAEIRDGTRPVPGSPQPADGGGDDG